MLIAYVTDTGHTRTLAEAVAMGARTVAGSCVWSLDVRGGAIDMLTDADAIVLGTPVHNGNPAAALLDWLDRWPFRNQPLKDRLGAAFVTAGGYHAGAESSLLALHRSLLSFGILIVGGEQWQAAYGVAATTNEAPFENRAIDAAFVSKAQQLGRRVAALAARWRAAAIDASPSPTP